MTLPPLQVWPGNPYPLGATYDGAGTNFSLFSEVATSVELCLIAKDGTETRIPLDEVDGYVWHCYLPTISRASVTASACTDRGIRKAGIGATPASCCSTRMEKPFTASSVTSRIPRRRCSPIR